MKKIQPKTLQIMIAILANPAFSQNGIWRLINKFRKISLGQVNKVVMDLEKKRFVEPLFRQKRSGDIEFHRSGSLMKKLEDENEKVTYRLVDPIGLLKYISLFRTMNDLRAFTVKLNAPADMIINELEKEKVIFCLGNAQSRYSPYFRPERVSFYSDDPERIYDRLKDEPYGDTIVDCYRVDYLRSVSEIESLLDGFFATAEGDIKLTTKVQTVLDMFCDGKGTYAKPLIKELWGVSI